MDRTAERLWLAAVGEVLARSHLVQPDQLAAAVDSAMSMSMLAIRTRIYRVDHEQRTLRPVPPPGRSDAAAPGQPGAGPPVS